MPPGGQAAPPPHCDPASDAIKPVPQQVLPGQRSRLPDQDKERRLEGVVHIIGVVENLPADAQDHGTVTRHQGLERRFVGACVVNRSRSCPPPTVRSPSRRRTTPGTAATSPPIRPRAIDISPTPLGLPPRVPRRDRTADAKYCAHLVPGDTDFSRWCREFSGEFGPGVPEGSWRGRPRACTLHQPPNRAGLNSARGGAFGPDPAGRTRETQVERLVSRLLAQGLRAARGVDLDKLHDTVHPGVRRDRSAENPRGQ